jgi:hypothetical protein
MNYYYTTIGLNGIMADIEVRYEVTKFYPATWDDPAEGGDMEIDCVKVVGITGATYEMARPEFKSWAKDLDEAAWIHAEEFLTDELNEEAQIDE